MSTAQWISLNHSGTQGKGNTELSPCKTNAYRLLNDNNRSFNPRLATSWRLVHRVSRPPPQGKKARAGELGNFDTPRGRGVPGKKKKQKNNGTSHRGASYYRASLGCERDDQFIATAYWDHTVTIIEDFSRQANWVHNYDLRKLLY